MKRSVVKVETAAERFLRYVTFDTRSAPGAQTVPSTPGQLEFARRLVDELHEIGAENPFLDAYGIVYASIPPTPGYEHRPAIGFIAHIDTSPDASGEHVAPRIVSGYDGGEIVLNQEQQIISSPVLFPHLGDYVGQDLIVTDGTTLLGADDKAGVAEIMAMAEKLLTAEIPHGPVKLAFTPDEEIGGSAMDDFDLERFGAEFAYTVDGGHIGEIEYENFNAANATVTVHGLGIHPGDAKGKMKNALQIAIELHEMLPGNARPEFTDGHEGFFHLDALSGCTEEAQMHYLIRDHDMEQFLAKKELLRQAVAYINLRYGPDTVELELADSYYNMLEKIRPHMHLIENASAAMQAVGVTPLMTPIRGGTDGARLSYRGIPCPNLSTGGHNSHGVYEYIPVQSLEKMSECLLKIVSIYAQD